MDSSLQQSLADEIGLQVKAGYSSRAEIIEAAIDMYNDEAEDHHQLRRLVAQLTDSALAVHYAEQRTWEHVTDCDKLDEAFAELDRNGIVARQNFACCQTCGHTEISYELGKTSVHRRVRGYAFFHQQDSETVASTDNLYLAYGAFNQGDDEALAVAWEVVRTLRQHGLSVEWNGKISKRIRIKDIHWQRRRLSESLGG
jgi:Arc/MetJ-type ribon-helix-helix transcriptional regulator